MSEGEWRWIHEFITKTLHIVIALIMVHHVASCCIMSHHKAPKSLIITINQKPLAKSDQKALAKSYHHENRLKNWTFEASVVKPRIKRGWNQKFKVWISPVFWQTRLFHVFLLCRKPPPPGTTMVFQRVENARPRLPAQHACHSRFRKSSLAPKRLSA